MTRGDVLRDQSAEGMADHMRAADAEIDSRMRDRFHQQSDSDLLRRRWRAPGARQIGTDNAKAGQRGNHRLKAVGGAAEPVQHHDRRPLAFRVDRHAAHMNGSHEERSTTSFSRTPMPPISMRTTSPAFRYFGG